MSVPGGVGYEVTISYPGHDELGPLLRPWAVRVRRLSDGQEVTRTFCWHWTAARFGRSTTRLGKACTNARRREQRTADHHVLRWSE